MKKYSIPVAVCLTAAVMAGCTPIKEVGAASVASSTAASTTTQPADPTPLETYSPPEPDPVSSDDPESEPEIVAFDTKRSWADGISVTVSKPKKFHPSEYAAGRDGFEKFVIVKVTLTNGSKKRFNPSMALTRGMSGDQEATQVFDSGNGADASGTATLRPGKSMTWNAAFGVEDYNDIDIEVAPSFDHKWLMWSTHPGQ